METISVKTGTRTELVDITVQIQQVIKKNKWADGILMAYVPHTTAGVFINENADQSVQKDILNQLNEMVPFEAGYSHSEGNSAAHIKTALVGSSTLLIVENTSLILGTWQCVYFAEFDGPRSRKMYLKFVSTDNDKS
ncbi:MAG: YjbQ family protein [Planctomycetes bacterium]|nr:YjbQ family protein [Planctomycetota bacterium]